jgi:hypothetical protein
VADDNDIVAARSVTSRRDRATDRMNTQTSVGGSTDKPLRRSGAPTNATFSRRSQSPQGPRRSCRGLEVLKGRGETAPARSIVSRFQRVDNTAGIGIAAASGLFPARS